MQVHDLVGNSVAIGYAGLLTSQDFADLGVFANKILERDYHKGRYTLLIDGLDVSRFDHRVF